MPSTYDARNSLLGLLNGDDYSRVIRVVGRFTHAALLSSRGTPQTLGCWRVSVERDWLSVVVERDPPFHCQWAFHIHSTAE